MATVFTQIVGETRIYQQSISGDDIDSVEWSSDPVGPALTNPTSTTTTASVFFHSEQVGSYVLTATMNLHSGQVVKGQVRINVVSDIV